MIKAVLIDDEPLVVKNLDNMLRKYCPQVSIAGTADSIDKGKKLIQATSPDLVYLDIEMPYGNGFDLLQSLKQISFEVIFVTAFDHYALDAYKKLAAGYLLKPIDICDLKAVTEKAELVIKGQHHVNSIEISTKSSIPTKIGLPTLEGLMFVKLDSIIYCKSSGNYTEFHFTDGTKYLVSKQISEYEKILPSSMFFRIHKENIINLNLVAKYVKGRGGYIIMENNATLNVSFRRKEDFLKKVALLGTSC